jgi:hypothetical protein
MVGWMVQCSFMPARVSQPVRAECRVQISDIPRHVPRFISFISLISFISFISLISFIANGKQSVE